MGFLAGEIEFFAYRKGLLTEEDIKAAYDGDYTGWTILIDNTAYAAIRQTWQNMPPALVAAYLYAHIFDN